MFNLTDEHEFFVYSKPCDMRKSFDGLVGLVKNELKKTPICQKSVFLFLNKNRTQLKLLHWEKNGFVIYYKKLQKGSFSMPTEAEISWLDLINLVKGIEVQKSIQKKRFSL